MQAHWNENLTLNGTLSVAKIIERHPLLKPVFEEGMTWFVWKGATEDAFPLLADIGQRALNAKYSVQQGQDVFQCFLRACHCWSSGMGKGRSDPSLFILKDIMKCNPKCSADDVQAVVEIARKYAGSTGKCVEPFKQILGSYKKAGRTVATSTLQAMGNLKLAPSEMCPHLMVTVLMLLASSPTTNFITKPDICSMTRKIDDVSIVESLIRSMIDKCVEIEVPKGKEMHILSQFRCS